jgi:glycosyltransferase involved in cell wall biosynthesis
MDTAEKIITVVIPFKSDSTNTQNLFVNINKILSNSDKVKLSLVVDLHPNEASNENIRNLQKICPPDAIQIQRCGSAGKARNIGKTGVTTKWLAFCDADDELFLDKVLEVISEAEKDEIDFIVGRYTRVSGEEGREIKENSALMKLSSVQQQIGREIGIWRFIFSTDLATQIYFPENNMGEDQVFLARFLRTNPKIFISDKIIYKYYSNVPGSLTNRSNKVRTIKEMIPLSKQQLKGDRNPWATTIEMLVLNQYLTYIKYEVGLKKIKACSGLIIHLLNPGRMKLRITLLARKITADD